MDPESVLMYSLWIKSILQVLSVCHRGNIFLKCDTDPAGGKEMTQMVDVRVIKEH